MKSYKIRHNRDFVGREHEISQLEEIDSQEKAALIIIYGRRRIGKTELIEQYYRKRVIFKFEGIEIDEKDKTLVTSEERRQYQIKNCLLQLAKYTENPLLQKIDGKEWSEFFEILDRTVSSADIVLYFEEVQWLANYEPRFFAELKPYWDNSWRNNTKLRLVICGSSVSFIVNSLISNKALYARSQKEFFLKELELPEVKAYFSKKGNRECLEASLLVGGICVYLDKLRAGSTVFDSFCKNSFLAGSFFSTEFDKIFVSSLNRNKNYSKIVEFLSTRSFATVKEISQFLKIDQKGGGNLSDLLKDLERCDFISRYTPIHKPGDSKIIRYQLSDEFLRSYFRFIHPQLDRIDTNSFKSDPLKAINKKSYEICLGLSFEHWCLKNERVIAKILGFSGLEYKVGSFFDRKSEALRKGFQIDLVFIIKGAKIVLCEIKYLVDLVSSKVGNDIRLKEELFLKSLPKYRNYTIEKVLITLDKPKPESAVSRAFDRIVSLDDLADIHYWR